MLDQPPAPAQVNLYAGNLSVIAENSTLSGIMHDITAKTGMTVEGLSTDQRIFGTYGPSNPREVLYSLLNGMGYNIMMVGDQSNGAPRQLLLSPRTGKPDNSGRPNNGGHGEIQPIQQSNADEDDSSQDTQDNAPPQPDVNQEPQTPPGQVKSPQQMLQELQQLRQRQQQQLQQQQPNPQ